MKYVQSQLVVQARAPARAHTLQPWTSHVYPQRAAILCSPTATTALSQTPLSPTWTSPRATLSPGGPPHSLHE